MKKHYFKIITFIFIILLLLGLSFYFLNKKIKNQSKNSLTNTPQKTEPIKREIMSKEEINSLGLYYLGTYEVLSRDETGKILTYQLIDMQSKKPLKLEYMTDSEKSEQGFAKDDKIQVIERDSSGKPLTYKIIGNNSDIITSY